MSFVSSCRLVWQAGRSACHVLYSILISRWLHAAAFCQWSQDETAGLRVRPLLDWVQRRWISIADALEDRHCFGISSCEIS